MISENIEAAPAIRKRNFRNVQIDAVGVGLASAAAPFLPVFLARLGASNFQVGLLTSMPGMAGLVLAFFVGRFLQTRRKIVPWFSLSRLMVLSCDALTGLVTLLIPRSGTVVTTLVIWAFATLPQTALSVCFTVVMNAVAGPDGRYALLSRRWAILGLTNFAATFLITEFIDRFTFPLNYAIMFLGLSLGGLISFYFSSRISLPDQVPPPLASGKTAGENIRNTLTLLRQYPDFVSISIKRFVYLSAVALAAPIMPLYFVHVVKATDADIGAINMIFTFFMLGGYLLWPWVTRRRSGRFVLLATTLGMVLYPLLTATTRYVTPIFIYTAVAGLFQGGLDLVFFDEYMKTIPDEYSAILVSLEQSIQYLSVVASPLIGTGLANYIGLGGALLVSAGLRLVGFLLFLVLKKKKAEEPVKKRQSLAK
ncbi:MAG TPA: MFS transporter [Anaerolineales bacterium]|nr:MFS transporter [Anaerolineales bacterium]